MLPLLATIVVLMYHRVAPDLPATAVGRDLTLPPASFAAQLDELQREKIPVLTTAQAAAAIARGGDPRGVVLTFDDGREDGYSVVAPLLRAHHMTATFYVNPSTIDTPHHFTWRELRDVRAQGDEVGCHGYQHLDLSQMDAAQQTFQIGKCIEMIAVHAPPRPTTYAYAAGRYDATTQGLMRKFGIVAAVTEHPGDVRPGVDPTQWPRERIRRTITLAQFEELVAPARR